MTSYRSQAQPKTNNERGMISIAEFIQKRNDYFNYPGKIVNGLLFVKYEGRWMPKKEFDKLVKLPITPNFTANLNNCDPTKLWIYS